jgi:hypothetical protein
MCVVCEWMDISGCTTQATLGGLGVGPFHASVVQGSVGVVALPALLSHALLLLQILRDQLHCLQPRR